MVLWKTMTDDSKTGVLVPWVLTNLLKMKYFWLQWKKKKTRGQQQKKLDIIQIETEQHSFEWTIGPTG